MLFRPEAFERLTDEPWDAGLARGRIRAIVADAEERFDAVSLWPAEEWDAWGSPTPLTGLYCGAAGVVWALDVLRRRGQAEVTIDLGGAMQRALERNREAPELSQAEGFQLPRASEAGLLSGETGVAVVARRVGGDGELDALIERRILESRESDANEVMWGAPGGLLAARAMLDWTGDARWAEVWTTAADSVWHARGDDGLWTQRLYGNTSRGLGPVHGLVGNTRALLGGGDLLAPERRERLVADTVSVLVLNAFREDGFANWPPHDGDGLERPDGDPRLQWCHGAPGIVSSTADFLPEELLLAGGELTWHAGPQGPDKGSSLCHGTAGNGYAFLKLFERTGDEEWLERARRFAVHALVQVERGAGRYSLFTGDLGVAVYAADCLGATTRYPLFETWD
jgi:Lanthionine synthetase C-like protein